MTKKALTFFFFCFFFVLSLFFRSQMVDFKENSFFKVPGGSNCLFPIETHITCDFQGGSGPPVPPLDPHMYNNNLSNLSSIKKQLLLIYWSNCLFPIETHITCDFQGGSGPPVPPLDPHMYNNNLSNLSSIKKQLLLILKKSLLTEFEKKKKENKDSQKGNDFLG